MNSNEVPRNSKQGQRNSNQVPGNSEQGPEHSNQVPRNSNQGPENSNQVPGNLNQGPKNNNHVPENSKSGQNTATPMYRMGKIVCEGEGRLRPPPLMPSFGFGFIPRLLADGCPLLCASPHR